LYITEYANKSTHLIYGEAFVEHERRFQQDYEMVQRWRKAFTKVGKISGWDMRDK
jgi:hypothetical protein